MANIVPNECALPPNRLDQRQMADNRASIAAAVPVTDRIGVVSGRLHLTKPGHLVGRQSGDTTAAWDETARSLSKRNLNGKRVSISRPRSSVKSGVGFKAALKAFATERLRVFTVVGRSWQCI